MFPSPLLFTLAKTNGMKKRKNGFIIFLIQPTIVKVQRRNVFGK